MKNSTYCKYLPYISTVLFEYDIQYCNIPLRYTEVFNIEVHAYEIHVLTKVNPNRSSEIKFNIILNPEKNTKIKSKL